MARPTLEELRARVGAQTDARGKRVIYAGVPGTGPAGETCRSCVWLRDTGGRKAYYKCGKTNYTHGDATRIRVRTPACDQWAARPAPPPLPPGVIPFPTRTFPAAVLELAARRRERPR